MVAIAMGGGYHWALPQGFAPRSPATWHQHGLPVPGLVEVWYTTHVAGGVVRWYKGLYNFRLHIRIVLLSGPSAKKTGRTPPLPAETSMAGPEGEGERERESPHPLGLGSWETKCMSRFFEPMGKMGLSARGSSSPYTLYGPGLRQRRKNPTQKCADI